MLVYRTLTLGMAESSDLGKRKLSKKIIAHLPGSSKRQKRSKPGSQLDEFIIDHSIGIRDALIPPLGFSLWRRGYCCHKGLRHDAKCKTQ